MAPLLLLYARTAVSDATAKIVDRYAPRARLLDDGSCLTFRTPTGLDVQVFHEGRRFTGASLYRAGTSDVHAHVSTLAAFAAVLHAREEVHASGEVAY